MTKIELASAGDIAIAAFALAVTVFNLWLFSKRSDYHEYLWSAVIAFASFLFAGGVVLQTNLETTMYLTLSVSLQFTGMLLMADGCISFVFTLTGHGLKIIRNVLHVVTGLWILVLFGTDWVVTDGVRFIRVLVLDQPFMQPNHGSLINTKVSQLIRATE